MKCEMTLGKNNHNQDTRHPHPGVVDWMSSLLGQERGGTQEDPVKLHMLTIHRQLKESKQQE